jgi:hypothetical protein
LLRASARLAERFLADAKNIFTVPDPAVLELLTSGSSSGVVGLRTPDGEPYATRCWGVRATNADPLRLELLLPAGSLAHLGRRAGDGASFALALTVADVRTLRAVQAKGVAHSLAEAAPEHHEQFEEYKARFFSAINRADGYQLELLERWAPKDLWVAQLDVESLFDQTPGPSAGATL